MQNLVQFNIRDGIDILLLAVIIYWLLILTKDTRAIQVLKGLGILLIIGRLAEIIELKALSWVMSQLLYFGVFIIAVLFQPELRRALEQLGRGEMIFKNRSFIKMEDNSWAANEIQSAVLRLAKRKVGALIVLARKTGLSDIAESGTQITGKVTSALIENIFEPNTPLHDGAMIIRGGEIVAAGCFLPLSGNKEIGKELGTRHRAALGVSEVSDSITIIVSEETGVISIARDGKLIRYLDSKALKDILMSILSRPSTDPFYSFLFKRRESK